MCKTPQHPDVKFGPASDRADQMSGYEKGYREGYAAGYSECWRDAHPELWATANRTPQE